MSMTASQLIDRSGLDPSEIASLCGVGLKTVYRWRNGESTPRGRHRKTLDSHAAMHTAQRRLPLEEFRFIDLFAGIGGFRRAFNAAGGECVFTSEWDKSCVKTYRENNPDDTHEVAGNIRDYTSDAKALDRIPQHDVLVAGFPCQPFSIAGVSKKNALGREHGFLCETQGTLFFDIAKILFHHRPAAFLLENVRNLVSHDKGNTFRIIKRTLEEDLGYQIRYRVVDGRAWVPQQRKRILIAGFRSDTSFDFDTLPMPTEMDWPKLGSILHNVEQEDVEEERFTVNGRVIDKYILSAGLWAYLQDYKKKHTAAGNGFGFGLVGPNDIARTLSARYYKDGSEILIRRGTTGRPRRLTPRECARLMGFDSPGQSNFRIPVSDTQAYKQFGNSVIVPMATAVAQHMKPSILQLVHGSSERSSVPATDSPGNKPIREPELSA